MVLEQLQAGHWQQITQAEMVMVARDPLNVGSAVVNPLIADTPEEREMVKVGEGGSPGALSPSVTPSALAPPATAPVGWSGYAEWYMYIGTRPVCATLVSKSRSANSLVAEASPIAKQTGIADGVWCVALIGFVAFERARVNYDHDHRMPSNGSEF